MTASEKLKAWGEYEIDQARGAALLEHAAEETRRILPQIVAVVEAAENSAEVRVGHTASLPKLQAALSALDEALS